MDEILYGLLLFTALWAVDNGVERLVSLFIGGLF
jgi:hypothetical protein